MTTEVIDPLLRIEEVEAICGMKRATIYRWMKQGRFPAPHKPGGYASRWSRAELQAWLGRQEAA